MAKVSIIVPQHGFLKKGHIYPNQITDLMHHPLSDQQVDAEF